jgi:hypothetical protein
MALFITIFYYRGKKHLYLSRSNLVCEVIGTDWTLLEFSYDRCHHFRLAGQWDHEAEIKNALFVFQRPDTSFVVWCLVTETNVGTLCDMLKQFI